MFLQIVLIQQMSSYHFLGLKTIIYFLNEACLKQHLFLNHYWRMNYEREFWLEKFLIKKFRTPSTTSLVNTIQSDWRLSFIKVFKSIALNIIFPKNGPKPRSDLKGSKGPENVCVSKADITFGLSHGIFSSYLKLQ